MGGAARHLRRFLLLLGRGLREPIRVVDPLELLVPRVHRLLLHAVRHLCAQIRLNCVPTPFSHSIYTDAGWHRVRRYNGTANPYLRSRLIREYTKHAACQ